MQVLLFDIDGTLINTQGAGGSALLAALRSEFGVEQPRRVPFSGRTDRGIVSSLFAHHEIEDTHENWERLCARYVRGLPQLLPQRRGRVLPGIERLLARLCGRDDVALGLLTGNIVAGARIKLSYFGLFQHFSFGGFGDRHRDRAGVAREALAAARQHLNGQLEPERVWVIGDTPRDIRCARAINARVLAVATGLHATDELAAETPDHLCDDLADTDGVCAVLDQS